MNKKFVHIRWGAKLLGDPSASPSTVPSILRQNSGQAWKPPWLSFALERKQKYTFALLLIQYLFVFDKVQLKRPGCPWKGVIRDVCGKKVVS
jgi:hypothetical protein